MENEHFSVSRVTNLYIILIVNSPGRSSIKFYTGKLCPGSNYLQIKYSFRIPFHSSLMVEGPSGLLQAYPQGVLKKVLYGEALPRGPCPYLSTYHVWQKKYSFRIPFHPFWRLRGGVACYRHFIPRGYSRKFYTGKPCSKVHVLTFPHTIFDRKGTPLVYHSIPFGGWGVGWLVTGILSPGGTQESFIRGSPAPRSMSLPFHIPFLTEKVLLSYTIPSLLAVEGWSGLLQAF